MPRRVVTLPPSLGADAAVAWAKTVRGRGADLVELRTDLHEDPPLAALAAIAPLLVAERGRPLPEAWTRVATLCDRELDGTAAGATLRSFHAEAPLSAEEAEARWAAEDLGEALLKHVEPLGPLAQADRLFETRARLQRRYGAERVTVLAMGALALPVRARLAPDNALDYLAVEGDADFRAAPGQRLLADAVRADGASGPRYGIIGTELRRSSAPRLHPAPFDRIDVPADTDLTGLLAALLPDYLGLVVASPFERPVAQLVGAETAAVDTLTKVHGRWVGHYAGQSVRRGRVLWGG
jgi:hypothetical protein